jgi:hypothetical protein
MPRRLFAPFYGRRLVADIPLGKVLPFFDKKVLFNVRWSAKGSGGEKAPGSFSRSDLEGFLAGLIERAETERLLDLKAVYGYFKCRSQKDILDVLDDAGLTVLESFVFPRSNRPPYRSLAGDFRPAGDTIVFQLVTAGAVAAEEGTRLFRNNRYRDVLFWHGFCAELAESLAGFIQQAIESEWGLPAARSAAARAGQAPRARMRRLFGSPGCGARGPGGLFHFSARGYAAHRDLRPRSGTLDVGLSRPPSPGRPPAGDRLPGASPFMGLIMGQAVQPRSGRPGAEGVVLLLLLLGCRSPPSMTGEPPGLVPGGRGPRRASCARFGHINGDASVFSFALTPPGPHVINRFRAVRASAAREEAR